MELIIDTIDLKEVADLIDHLPVVGVTSNPSIVKRTRPEDFYAHMEALKKLIGPRHLHVQVIAKDAEGMIKEDRPHVKVGDVVKVHVKIREGERERIQVFEGTIIAVKGSGVSETFTVRRVSYGVGVERVFPVNSPNVAKVELVRSGKVRRSKLYYLRDRVGKAAKVKEQI